MAEQPQVRLIASNLHRGGAVQVAASLVTELSRLPDASQRIVFEVSSEVAAELPPRLRDRVEILDRRPSSWRLWLSDVRRRERVRFVVFSPAWFPVGGRRRVCGYADVTALYDLDRRGMPARAKAWLSRRQLRRFDMIIVETQAVADRVVALVPQVASRVRVVGNTVSAAVLTGSDPVDVPPAPDRLTLAYPAAPYRHKNHAYLGPLAQRLAERGIEVRYLLTLPDADFANLSAAVRERSVNLGPLRQSQMRALYSSADGVIFPSLLEASSATPLEALALGVPLLASDRDFVRSLCGDAAYYFDPRDPADGARVIADALEHGIRAKVERGRAVAAGSQTATDRARSVWELITGETPATPRLLVVNNLPAFYRSPLYAAVAAEFRRRTGGPTLVAYQVRRAARERDEWFFTPEGQLRFPHRFAQADFRYLRGRKLPGRPRLDLVRGFRPTHVFTAGWDTPLSWAAARYAAHTDAGLGVWVESSPLTTRHRGRLLDGVRRAFLAPADLAVVPTAASGKYVAELAGRDIATVRLLNPVDLDRIENDRGGATRAVFIGDLSRRKGFDRFAAVAPLLRAADVECHAWGRDVENLARTAAGVVLHAPRPVAEIARDLSADDVLVLPSRVDPAPLTFSEALAWGLRVVVSDEISYAELPAELNGVYAAPCCDATGLADAVVRARRGPRPDERSAERVSAEFFARALVDGLLGP